MLTRQVAISLITLILMFFIPGYVNGQVELYYSPLDSNIISLTNRGGAVDSLNRIEERTKTLEKLLKTEISYENFYSLDQFNFTLRTNNETESVIFYSGKNYVDFLGVNSIKSNTVSSTSEEYKYSIVLTEKVANLLDIHSIEEQYFEVVFQDMIDGVEVSRQLDLKVIEIYEPVTVTTTLFGRSGGTPHFNYCFVSPAVYDAYSVNNESYYQSIVLRAGRNLNIKDRENIYATLGTFKAKFDLVESRKNIYRPLLEVLENCIMMSSIVIMVCLLSFSLLRNEDLSKTIMIRQIYFANKKRLSLMIFFSNLIFYFKGALVSLLFYVFLALLSKYIMHFSFILSGSQLMVLSILLLIILLQSIFAMIHLMKSKTKIGGFRI